jgi:hypothetical protein
MPTTGKERRITRWNTRTFSKPCSGGSMRIRRPCGGDARRSSIPFGTIKARTGATHFLMKTLPKVAGEMALSVLAYNLTRVMNTHHEQSFIILSF